MKAPDKIYTDNRGVYAELPIFSQTDANVEYIRKDVVDDMIKTAEDHAYFAGKEKLREELLKMIEQIRTEIKRLEGIDYPCDTHEEAIGFYDALGRISDFLDTLQDPNTADKNAVKEIVKTTHKEVTRQVKEMVKELQEQDVDLDEAANKYENGYFDNCSAAKRASYHGFVAGAKWQKEQIMDEAIEGEVQVVTTKAGWRHSFQVFAPYCGEIHTGQKVIIIPKEKEG